MPIYSYRCAGCGAEFDQLVRSETVVACPECRGRQLERLMSLPARHASAGGSATRSLSALGPPAGGGCCGGACGRHSHGH